MCGAQVNILKYVISSMIVAIKVNEVNGTPVFFLLIFTFLPTYIQDDSRQGKVN